MEHECSVCGESKPADEFPSKTYRGLWRCLDCRRVARRATQTRWDGRNRHRFKDYYARYRATHREQDRDARLRARFGITAEEYAAMLARQDGGCAICGTPPANGRNLAVDHDHETGLVRGLLCSNCNRGIGHLRESPAVLRAAIAYLAG